MASPRNLRRLVGMITPYSNAVHLSNKNCPGLRTCAGIGNARVGTRLMSVHSNGRENGRLRHPWRRDQSQDSLISDVIPFSLDQVLSTLIQIFSTRRCIPSPIFEYDGKHIYRIAPMQLSNQPSKHATRADSRPNPYDMGCRFLPESEQGAIIHLF